MQTGKVIQIIGAAVDIEFEQGHLPAIENAIEIELEGSKKIVAEVAQQMGDGIVRCVALESTDGLQRGAKAIDTTCRNHGSCSYCESNRQIQKTKARKRADAMLKEFKQGEW